MAGLPKAMKTSDFDYHLPRELIATHPAAHRDESRLLVLDRGSGAIEHRQFSDILEFVRPGDLMVMNDSRVIKARLRGVRRATGAGVEALMLAPATAEDVAATSQTGCCRWLAFCRPAKKFRVGEIIDFANGNMPASVIAEGDEGERILEFASGDIIALLEKHGEIPLPPYIVQRRKETEAGGAAAGDAEDAERYQTVYARQKGSIAAPTAGLHFTPALLDAITGKGGRLAWVTLHVGAGTFRPVEVDDPSLHPMHSELYEVPAETAKIIIETRAIGGRVIAVGTTTVRTLESAYDLKENNFALGRQSTRLLILPGYRFQVVDAIITNFHLPRSSLLMMISAFAGHEYLMAAYREAIAQNYRFYSYGDAMFIGSGWRT